MHFARVFFCLNYLFNIFSFSSLPSAFRSFITSSLLAYPWRKQSIKPRFPDWDMWNIFIVTCAYLPRRGKTILLVRLYKICTWGAQTIYYVIVCSVQISLTTSITYSVACISCSQYSLRSGRSGNGIPVRAKFLAPIQTRSGANPPFYKMGTRSLSRRKADGKWR
jgi:hypothetical protein